MLGTNQCWLTTALVVLSGLSIGCVAHAAEADEQRPTAPQSRRSKGSQGSKCSAASLSPKLPPVPGLTPAAAETRRRIVEAAIACDYDALDRLARQHRGFAFTFGPDEMGPGTHWRQREEKGGRHLAALALILQMPAHSEPGSAFVWPSVWDPLEERTPRPSEWKALSKLYSPEHLRRFKEEGYTGWRTAIMPDGTWLYFVAGD